MTDGLWQEEALRLYFSCRMEAEEIAQSLGVTQAQVLVALGDLSLLKPYRERVEAAKLRAQICVYEQAEEAAKKQAELVSLGEAAGAQAVSQRAAKDILDRAGICVDAQDLRDIRIRFEGMPPLGMPPSEGGDDGTDASL
ncbi:MAG: hypothetical protein IKU73_01965 [Clostridia bacterium]|nr:hypothetical protein [Clostridia bacterium]